MDVGLWGGGMEESTDGDGFEQMSPEGNGLWQRCQIC